MGVIAEKMSDDKGLNWHANVAPYHVYLATIGDVDEQAQKLVDDLIAAGVEVLWDDRDVRPGEKFADADLMGIPLRIVLGPKTLAEGSVELKSRMAADERLVKTDDIVSTVTQAIGLSA